MDPKELRGLMEAYSEVYAPQEEIEEGMKPLPKEKMDRQAMKAYKKERSAIDRRDDPEANRQMQRRIAMQSPASRRNVLDKKKMGEEVEQIDEISAGLAGKVVNARIAATGAAADRENKYRTPQNVRDTVAAADKEARARKLAAGVRKRRAANEEVDIFDVVLEFLQVEGYAETLEEAEWLMANVIDEEAIEIVLGEAKVKLDQERRSRMGRQIGKKVRSAEVEYSLSKDTIYPKGLRDAMEKGARKKVGQAQKIMGALKSAQKEEYVDEASRADDTTRANIARYAGKKGISFEPGPNWDPSANRGKGAHLNPKQKEKQRRKALRAEEYVDEAQEARNNPEKYERKQAKKSAPVRGEKTPMPPRGDKRREDFEKWYAANVR
jgi:hypothetical protein